MTTVRLTVPASDVLDADVIHALTGAAGFIPRRADHVNPLRDPTGAKVTIGGAYLVNGKDAGTGIWTWPTNREATIERGTQP